MPYSNTSELPPVVRSKLKGKKLRQWMHVWNSSYDRHGNEDRAFAEAWAAVKKVMPTAFGKANAMSDFQFFMPIAKVEKKADGTCIVSGYASTPTKDSDGEIVTLDAIHKALPDYMEWGNVREMHQLKAVGKAEEANIDNVGLFLRAKISDPVAVKKCEDKVYQGFSIGGRKLEKKGDKITAIDLTEISVVDRPANPDCRLSLAKSAKAKGEEDGGYLVKTKIKMQPESKALVKMAKVVESLAKANSPAAHDGFSLPAKVAANASPKDTTEQVNKGEDDAVPCKAHGKINCDKCSAAKTDLVAVPAEDKKKKKQAKKLAKAKLEAAFGLRNESFLTLGKRATSSGNAKEAAPVFEKSMNTAGSLAYCFDSIRSAQRSLLMEGKREGGDSKDKQLAKQLGNIAKELAGVIGQKATHEGEEALDMTDADDQYLSQYLGEDFAMANKAMQVNSSGDPIADAVTALLKRAAMPTKAARMKMAADNIGKSRKACKTAQKEIEAVHKLLKANYIAKMEKAKKAKPSDDDGDEFDHAGAMEKLNKAFAKVNEARTMAKAASTQLEKAARSGQRGQETGDGDEFYQVPPGVKDLSPETIAGAAPGTAGGGSQPPMYPADGGVYPGKSADASDLRKYAKNGVVSADVAELIMKNAKAEGELEALRRIPAAGQGRRPFAFDMTKVVAGTGNAQGGEINKALFDGVDVSALNSGDEMRHTEASARTIGNLLTSGHFGKSILDPSFRGMAGSK